MNLFDIQEDVIVASTKVSDRAVTLYKENCKDCGGTGNWIGGRYDSIVRTCFACKGRGFHEFKTSAAERAKNRESARLSAERKVQKSIDAFKFDFPAEYEWMVFSAPTFDFAQSMLDSVKKYGSLTEKQLAAVQKCVAKMNERKAEIRARAESAPEVTVTAIADAFNSAKEKGIKHPRLRLDTFVFTPAPDNGNNAGAIYVKEGEQYLGKVLNGRFLKVRDCNADQESRIIEVSKDPKASAQAYGRRYGNCAVCNRELSQKDSVELGIGPICASRMGW
jgi:hypothetical protein